MKRQLEPKTAASKAELDKQKEEVARIVSATGLDIKSLAERAAMNPETLRKWANGYQPMPESYLVALKNLQTVIEMQNAPIVRQSVDAEPNARFVEWDRSKFRLVPVVAWACAGAAHDYSDLCNQLDLKVGSDCPDLNAFALILEGDSMEPDFRAGDRVVFMPNTEARNGDCVVARLKEGYGVLFKKFRRTGPEGSIIHLESLNSAYGPKDYPVESFRFIYPAFEMNRMVRK